MCELYKKKEKTRKEKNNCYKLLHAKLEWLTYDHTPIHFHIFHGKADADVAASKIHKYLCIYDCKFSKVHCKALYNVSVDHCSWDL